MIVPAFEIPFQLEYAQRYCAIQGVTMEAVIRGEVFVGEGADRTVLTPDLFARLVMLADPVAYCEVMMRNRAEQGGGSWRLFPYQKPSMRWRGDVVHSDGAGVGKTRELVGLSFWFNHARHQGCLITGALDVNLEQIYQEMEFQIDSNALLRSEFAKFRLKPYRDLNWKDGVSTRLRPAGHDGRAQRGEHVHGMLAFDEADKADNPDTFSEFRSRAMPGAELRYYSVPTGRKTTPFAHMAQRATPWSSGLSAETLTQQGRAVLFNWPKSLMPYPFWSDEVDRLEQERHGGRDSSGYVRNVLGLAGDPEDSVFPWARYSPCLGLVSEYVTCKVLNDSATKTIYIEAHRQNPSFTLRPGGSRDEPDDGPSAMVEVYRDNFQPGNFDLEAVLRRVFQELPPACHAVGGADIGQNEPTEIHVNELRGEVSRFSKRLQLKGMSYDEIASAFGAMEKIYRPDHGWGMDATGVGKPVEDCLRAYTGCFSRAPDRLTGFVFNVKVDARNPATGEITIGPDQKPRRVNYKELGTELLEHRFNRGLFLFPWEPELTNDFTSHTARKLPSGERQFSGTNDHTVDAQRTAALRLFELEHGEGVMPPLTFATPQGSARDRTLDSL